MKKIMFSDRFGLTQAADDIKKAADDFAEREYEIGDVDKDALRKGFLHGALWRIDAMWHVMRNEVPQAHGKHENERYPSIPCLVKGYLSTGYGYGVRHWNVAYEVWDGEDADDFECKKDEIEYWAYLDDIVFEERGDGQ